MTGFKPLKSSSPVCKQKQTGLVNKMLASGEEPASLQTGLRTLINKKELAMEIMKKRPLTVSSIVLSVVTKLFHKHMSLVCERKGFLSSFQYVFMKKRSSTDCFFLLLDAIRKACCKHQAISIAFCNLAKAYDSVCWELLYTKLINFGFSRRVASLIRSMYYNDSIRVNLMNGLSSPGMVYQRW